MFDVDDQPVSGLLLVSVVLASVAVVALSVGYVLAG